MSGDDLNGDDLNGAELNGADLSGELGQTDVKKFQIHLIGHIDQCIKRLFG